MLSFLSTLQPLADAGSGLYLIQPTVILILCVAGGIGTVLLLPSRKQSPKVGGLLLIITGLIFALILFRTVVGRATSDTGPYFWIFSAITIVGAIRVITHPRPVYSALYFVLTVFASAGLFVLMYAEFMAAALVLIYAGAILITYVFVIMLAASAQTVGDRSPLAGLAECDTQSREPFTAACVGFALMGVLLFVIFDKAGQLGPFPVAAAPIGASAEEQVHGSTQSIGQYLFQSQMVNFELAGLILTVAMVGAIVIARRKVVDINQRFEPSVETITANATPVNDDPRSIPVYGTTNPKQKSFPQT
ncbi:MAG TPA: NADH-quinone oxidoreductase subunit J [Tepidisphaeraceae bacterium]|jgi:NADH-quinone oxidoreductase subunit J